MFRFIALPVAEREAMGLRARAHVEQYFDQKIVIAKYLEVIQSL